MERPIKVHMRKKGLKIEIERDQMALALKTWRIRNGYTQRQLAEKWGTSRYTIMRVEAGTPISWQYSYKIFAKLAEENAVYHNY